jgi:transposase
MTMIILGIDLGKSVCSVVGMDESGAVVLRRRMRRQTVIGFAAKQSACTVVNRAGIAGGHFM